MRNNLKSLLLAAKAIQDDASVLELSLPPDEGPIKRGEMVLANSQVRKTRGYIEKVTAQINCTYEDGCYDACAVMIRRLIETLIIEVFEAYQISSNIQDLSGNYLMLSELIPRTLAEKAFTLGRNASKALPNFKSIGDLAAHSRRYNAHRSDIDNIKADLRLVVQELLVLARLK